MQYKGQYSNAIKSNVRAWFWEFWEYKKVQRSPPLTSQHKKQRVEFAREWIGDNVLNKNVVFNDEKRFSFGPDNWFSWYDPFNPPQRIKRHLGGGGVNNGMADDFRPVKST